MKILLAIFVFTTAIFTPGTAGTWETEDSYFKNGSQRLSKGAVASALVDSSQYTETSNQGELNKYFNQLYFSVVHAGEDHIERLCQNLLKIKSRQTMATYLLLRKMLNQSVAVDTVYQSLETAINRFYGVWQKQYAINDLAVVNCEITKVALTLHYTPDLQLQVERPHTGIPLLDAVAPLITVTGTNLVLTEQDE